MIFWLLILHGLAARDAFLSCSGVTEGVERTIEWTVVLKSSGKAKLIQKWGPRRRVCDLRLLAADQDHLEKDLFEFERQSCRSKLSEKEQEEYLPHMYLTLEKKTGKGFFQWSSSLESSPCQADIYLQKAIKKKNWKWGSEARSARPKPKVQEVPTGDQSKTKSKKKPLK